MRARASSKPWPSDQELVQEILSGSQQHFDLLYSAYFPRVYRFALKRLSDPGEAEDVAQEVFMTLLSALPSYQGQSALLVWIFGITRNKVNRRFRKPRPRLEPLESGSALDVAGREVSTEEAVEARRVLGRCEEIIMQELTPLQRGSIVSIVFVGVAAGNFNAYGSSHRRIQFQPFSVWKFYIKL